VNVHHVPLVAAARPLDLLDRAKHLLDSANVGEKCPAKTVSGVHSIPASTVGRAFARRYSGSASGIKALLAPRALGDTTPGGLLCGHGVRLCTGGQWITWIVGSGHKLRG